MQLCAVWLKASPRRGGRRALVRRRDRRGRTPGCPGERLIGRAGSNSGRRHRTRCRQAVADVDADEERGARTSLGLFDRYGTAPWILSDLVACRLP
jgi:hypothetical protein